MSRLWWFCSFNPRRFAAYFDGSEPDAARQIIEAATWEDGVWEDPEAPERLAARITEAGIRYDELLESDASALDELIALLFSPEGLAEQWEVVAESPDGLHPSLIRELLLHNRDAVFLPILLEGRRYGADLPSPSAYCFLSSAECTQLIEEAKQALATGGPWSERWVPDVVAECLCAPLQAAVAKRRPIFGSLG